MDASSAGKRPGLPLPVILASVAVFIFCSLFSSLVFERVPHVHDEIAYLFQAKLFHSGRLYAPSPPCRESFDFPHIINNGRWYSMYPPGFPLLLTIGLIFRVPWLINPLLAALSVILVYFLGKEIYGPKVGRLAAVLCAISPWFLVMSSTMMSHTASLFFNALSMLFLFKSIRIPSFLLGLAAGISWGMAFLVRPLNTVFFSLVFLVFYAFRTIKTRRGSVFKNAFAFGSAALAFLGILLIYNSLTNGGPLRMGYIVRYGASYSVIFGRAATLDSPYTPLSATSQMVDNLRALNTDLFGWPFSSFLAMLPFFWLIRMKTREKRWDFLFLSAFVFLIVVYYFFWGAFVFIGARMLFETLPLLLLLSARGILELPALVARTSRKISTSVVRKGTVILLIAFVGYAFLYGLPRRLRPLHGYWFFDRYDERFAGTSGRLAQTIEPLVDGRALIVLKFWNRPPPAFPREGGWGSGFIKNNPDLGRAIIYARPGGKSYSEIFACYPTRKIYIYAGTLDKGILIPVRFRDGRVEEGAPVRPAARGKDAVVLVKDPTNVFFWYSPRFSRFISNLFQDISPIDLDGRKLEERGVFYQEADDFSRAAFCFEAALQVENDPATRRNLLNRLVPCYQKSGQREEALRILQFMESVKFDERRLYGVLPERGF